MNTLEILTLFLLAIGFSYLLDYFAEVLPETRQLTSYHCNSCGQSIEILDFILLKACRYCEGSRNKRVLKILPINLVIALIISVFPTTKIPEWGFFIIIQYFILVFIHDIEHRAVLNQVSIIGAVISIIFGSFIHDPLSTVEGAATGFLIMLALYYLGIGFNFWVGKIRNQEVSEIALGFGDVYISGIIGAFLGWPLILAGIFLAIIGAGLISAGIIIIRMLQKNYHPFEAIPYAPFLALSCVILLFLNVR